MSDAWPLLVSDCLQGFDHLRSLAAMRKLSDTKTVCFSIDDQEIPSWKVEYMHRATLSARCKQLSDVEAEISALIRQVSQIQAQIRVCEERRDELSRDCSRLRAILPGRSAPSAPPSLFEGFERLSASMKARAERTPLSDSSDESSPLSRTILGGSMVKKPTDADTSVSPGWGQFRSDSVASTPVIHVETVTGIFLNPMCFLIGVNTHASHLCTLKVSMSNLPGALESQILLSCMPFG